MYVHHFHWRRWPDRGVPQNDLAPLRLLFHVQQFRRSVVHCSAGIGRTGTLVALHIAYDTLQRGQRLNILALASFPLPSLVVAMPNFIVVQIFICADCWLLVFDFLTPSQLGLGIALISRRFDLRVDEHFKTRKWTLNKQLIIQWDIEKNGTKEMQIVNSDGEALPIPQKPLPNKVIGFSKGIQITYIDQNVIEFLRYFHRFFATFAMDLDIVTENDRNLEFVLHNIRPVFRDSIRRLFLNAIAFQRMCQLDSSLLSVHHFAVSLSMMPFCPNFRSMTMPIHQMAKCWPNGCSRLVRMVCPSGSNALLIHRWINGRQRLNNSKRHFPMLLRQ
ncbi:hypothetical protein niasHT_027436 [Heterodera trifolii]|uniref:Uncharacterized protein n=1 Tax=Heterodera trifolii TaxID=157864 RepID=A0ABD2JSI0_9BILA